MKNHFFTRFMWTITILGFIGACQTSAVTLNFNGLATLTNFGSLTEQGFTFTGNGTHFVLPGGSNACSPDCAFNGTDYLATNGSSGSLTFTLAGGGVFSLTQFDGAELRAGNINSIQLDATLSNSTNISTSFNVDGINDGGGALADFETFTVNGFTNLTSLTFRGISGAFAIDNVNLLSGESASVPEPTSLAFLAFAFACLGSKKIFLKS